MAEDVQEYNITITPTHRSPMRVTAYKILAHMRMNREQCCRHM